jgi:hypothetical protein
MIMAGCDSAGAVMPLRVSVGGSSCRPSLASRALFLLLQGMGTQDLTAATIRAAVFLHAR